MLDSGWICGVLVVFCGMGCLDDWGLGWIIVDVMLV